LPSRTKIGVAVLRSDATLLGVMNLKRHVLSTATLAFVMAIAPLIAHGQVSTPRASVGCTGNGETSGEVARVTDGRSFLLADGREVRLAAIETVLLVPGDEDEARVAAGAAARAALETLVQGRHVALRLPGPGPDRYGRLVAHAFVQTASDDVLVQGRLLAAGQALVSPVPLAAGCRAYLRDAERDARARRLGLWGDPYYVVRAARNADDVLAEQGRFALVEGKVATARESGGIIYLNFGERWSEDFTVTILRRNQHMFAGAGLRPLALAGLEVEVRGWIEDRGGPVIEVARPEQIEIIN
jgi:endonuclease YncB( thermonuclease family)